MNRKQQEALDSAKKRFKYLVNHTGMQAYRTKLIEDFGFYDGDKQWPEDVKAAYKQNNVPIITVNKIKNLVNYMAGVEIQTRFRTAFRSHSLDASDDKLAEAITHIGYAIQEQQNMSFQSSLKFRDALITGIGWSNIYKEPSTGIITYEHVDPSEILFDIDDLSPNLDNMSYVCRSRWLPLYKALELWPNHSKQLKDMCDEDGIGNNGVDSGVLDQRNNPIMGQYTKGSGQGGLIQVIEVQHKETQKSYKGLDTQGRSFHTFDWDEANGLSVEGQEIEITKAVSIMRTVFTDDILLEYEPLEPCIPNLPDFTYIPCIWGRRHGDGVPDGWISVMKEVQREINYRKSKMVQAINSFRVIADSSILSDGKSIEHLRSELKRPDSVVIIPPDCKLDIKSNLDIAKGQFDILNNSDNELQQVSGIYDEALGKETNATSGVAIQQRQVNSVRNQVFAFDNLRMMKKREAKMMLALIQGGGDVDLASEILTDEGKESLILNLSREVNGKMEILNDIRTLPISIYVEEVPDFESSAQEQRATIEQLLQNPNAMILLQSPMLMKRLGIRDYEGISKEFQEINQAEQNANSQPMREAEQTPEQDVLNNQEMMQMS